VHPAYPDFNMGQQTVMSPPAGADTQQNPYANSGSAKPAAPAVAQQVEPRASAVAMSNPYTNQQPLAATQVVNQPTTPSIPETTTAQVQLPPGSPPLGFDGYCPVTMKREWRWQKGDVNWGAVHRGKTYLFSSQEARDEFLKPGNGDLYAPVLGGIDPVLAIDNGNSVPGSRQFSVEYGGNFYLFSSEQTLSQFWGSADRYATGVRQAMAAPAPTNYR
jgi:YHS domain-containing protein